MGKANNERGAVTLLGQALRTPREIIAVVCDNAELRGLAKQARELLGTIDSILAVRGGADKPTVAGAGARGSDEPASLSKWVAAELRSAEHPMSLEELRGALAAAGCAVEPVQVSHAVANAMKGDSKVIRVGRGIYTVRRGRGSGKRTSVGKRTSGSGRKGLGATVAIREALTKAWPNAMHSSDIMQALHGKGVAIGQASLSVMLHRVSSGSAAFAQKVSPGTFMLLQAPREAAAMDAPSA